MQSAKAAAKGPAKKKRAKKDKDAPKGAMSAFMQFSQKERPGVSRESKRRGRKRLYIQNNAIPFPSALTLCSTWRQRKHFAAL